MSKISQKVFFFYTPNRHVNREGFSIQLQPVDKMFVNAEFKANKDPKIGTQSFNYVKICQ